MEGLTVLREAREAGLVVLGEGEELVVRGPQSAEALVRRLLDRKPAVVDALRLEEQRGAERGARRRIESIHDDAPAFYAAFQPWPPPCYSCRCLVRWRRGAGEWICARCHPPLAGAKGISWTEVSPTWPDSDEGGGRP